MIESRINDPESITTHDIERILHKGLLPPTVQFSGPGYTPALLRCINRLCVAFDKRLEVRFYGHSGQAFDASVLSHLPDVRWLSVDCLDEIVNDHHLQRLSHLERLSFGVHRFSKPKFLSGLQFDRMRELRLAGSAANNFDLAPLSAGRALSEVFIQGHTKNIEALATLPKLSRLTLSGMPKRQPLSFVSGIRALRMLKLLLGSRMSVDEISHERLESLEIVWVRGLESVGDLRRIPALQRLFIDGQLRLRTISLAGVKLRELSVHNCKNLTSISGIESQPRLEHFRTSRTKLDLDALLDLTWPPTMKIVALYSGSEKWNARARTVLGQRGYADN